MDKTYDGDSLQVERLDTKEAIEMIGEIMELRSDKVSKWESFTFFSIIRTWGRDKLTIDQTMRLNRIYDRVMR